ncbi:MAG TPA: glycosyltransferase [Acidimicrobiia bacterium]
MSPPAIGEWAPELAISVIIPYFQAEQQLRLTLAGLKRQTYPAELMEVIVVDDGSAFPLAGLEGLPLDPIRLVQEKRGFGAARARNLGARQASGQVILFLDCDMLPEPEWAEAHARWHHLAGDVATLGFRRHVEAEGLEPAAVEGADSLDTLMAGRRVETPDWIEVHMVRTADLTSSDDDLFRVVTSGNLGVGAETFAAVGGFDESFDRWGGEDTEFGYRLFNYGSLLVPERRAFCWHQGLGVVPDPGETVALEDQRSRLSQLVAERTFRRQTPGRSFSVPEVVVEIESTNAEQTARLVDEVLASRHHDLVVWVRAAPGLARRDWLAFRYQGDPRVGIAAGQTDDDHPNSAVRIEIADDVAISDRTVGRLLEGMRGVGVVEVPVEGTPGIRAWKVRATRRAERLGSVVAAGDLFGTRRLRAEDVLVSPARSVTGPREAGDLGKVLTRLRAVRTPGDLASFGRWFRAGVKVKLGSGPATISTTGPLAPAASAAAGPVVMGYGAIDPMGTGLHWGGAATLRKTRGRVDLVVFDGEPPADAGTIEAAGGRLLDASNLEPPQSLAAFEPAALRPTRVAVKLEGAVFCGQAPGPEAAEWVASLGITALAAPLPSSVDDRSVAGFVGSHPDLLFVDHPASHPGPAARAAFLLRLAACGVPVLAADLGGDIEKLLGPELVDAISSLTPQRVDDPSERELATVNSRRAALRLHSHEARLRSIMGAADLIVPAPPTVSVVLASRRLTYLPEVLADMAAQTMPLQLVLAVHGSEPGEAASLAERAGLADFELVLADPGAPLGEVLNAASSRADGDLITKVDDDDLYAPDHLFDLVAALQSSGATLVGKGAEFVYLSESGRTIRRFRGGAHSSSTTVGGGTLMIRRQDLWEAGGWRRVSSEVDRRLIQDVLRTGGTVHRTHPHGYVLRRHADGHTWQRDETDFLAQADLTWDGLERRLTGLG